MPSGRADFIRPWRAEFELAIWPGELPPWKCVASARAVHAGGTNAMANWWRSPDAPSQVQAELLTAPVCRRCRCGHRRGMVVQDQHAVRQVVIAAMVAAEEVMHRLVKLDADGRILVVQQKSRHVVRHFCRMLTSTVSGPSRAASGSPTAASTRPDRRKNAGAHRFSDVNRPAVERVHRHGWLPA